MERITEKSASTGSTSTSDKASLTVNGRKYGGFFVFRPYREPIYTPPEEYKYHYDVRHSDDDWGMPASIRKEKKVIVNYFGTFFCKEEIEFPKVDVNQPEPVTGDPEIDAKFPEPDDEFDIDDFEIYDDEDD